MSFHSSVSQKRDFVRKLRQLQDQGNSTLVNDILAAMWAHHCHPGEHSDSFVHKDSVTINRYKFDIEKIPPGIFQDILNRLGVYLRLRLF